MESIITTLVLSASVFVGGFIVPAQEATPAEPMHSFSSSVGVAPAN